MFNTPTTNALARIAVASAIAALISLRQPLELCRQKVQHGLAVDSEPEHSPPAPTPMPPVSNRDVRKVKARH